MPSKAAPPDVTVTQKKPHDIWREKDDIADREYRSRQFWAGIEDDERAAVILLVKDTLLRLLENPDSWVPISLDPTDANRIDVVISIQMASIEKGRLRQRISEERLRADVESDLISTLRELDADEA